MSPRVSIILTTHGQAPYLKQAIGSVLAQTFEDWECLIVVDGVFDGMKMWENGVDQIDNRFLIHGCSVPDGTSCRFAATINQCFKYTTGEYLTYLCHDDLYLPWRLERMVSWFSQNKNEHVLFGYQQLLEQKEDGGFRYYMGSGATYGGVRQGSEENPAGTVDHSSVMHRRECFERAGGWDENAPARYGDAYFWLRLQNAGYKFHCIPEVLDVHRFNRESITWQEDHPAKETAKCQ